MTDIDDQVREYYQDCCMSKQRINAILTAGEQCCWGRRIMGWSLGLAAALLLFTALINYGFKDDLGNQSAQRIVVEVARSHANNLDPEFSTSDFVELQDKLKRLDFSVLPANSFITEQYSLVGGRYCHIYTCLAVEIRLRDKATGESVTLYVAKLDDQLGSARDDIRVVDGVRVQVWKDEERFFAMARSVDSSPVDV